MQRCQRQQGAWRSESPLNFSPLWNGRLRPAPAPCPAWRQPLSNQAMQSLLLSRATKPQPINNRPDDEYEQEAERAEERVLPFQTASSLTEGVKGRTQVVPGEGQALPEAVGSFFESRFNYDFSHVRLHTGVRAAESARSLDARAYTVGRDVVFGAGEYAPETATGQRLLAHELAHVVQQSTKPPMIQRQGLRNRPIRLPRPHLGPPARPLPHLLTPEESTFDRCVPIFDRILDAFYLARGAVAEANRRLADFYVAISSAGGRRVGVNAAVACSLASNFNVDERTPNWVSLVRTIQQNLFIISILMRDFNPARDIVCERPGHPQCTSAEGSAYRGFATVGGPRPIHLCHGWRYNPQLGPKTILHEVTHLTGRRDHQYFNAHAPIDAPAGSSYTSETAELILPEASCSRLQRFTITPDLTIENADSYAYFAMDFRPTD